MAIPKKGQLGIFMIVSVVILLLVGWALYQMSLKTTENIKKELPSQMVLGETVAVQQFVTACLEQTTTDALINFGLVGGKTGYFKDFLTYDSSYKVPYYFKTNTFDDSASIVPGSVFAPPKADVESILMSYIDAHLKECTDSFKNVKGLRVEEGSPKSTVQVNEKDVSVKLNYPLVITQVDKKTNLDEFTLKILSRLNTMLLISHNITSFAKEQEDIVYWDYLTDVTRMCEPVGNPRAPAADWCFNITAHAERQNTIIYRIVDPQSLVFNEPYFFQFAAQVRVK